jgi:5'-methylthioadenosine phosphorylase
MAHPVGPKLVERLLAAATAEDIAIRKGGTYVCMEGPQFSSYAESTTYRHLGYDVIGMTAMPEAKLAREAEITYATLAMVTDYDCWMEDPGQHVSMNALLERYRQTMEGARNLLETMLSSTLPEPERDIRESLAHAVMTPDSQLTSAQREWLGVLRR